MKRAVWLCTVIAIAAVAQPSIVMAETVDIPIALPEPFFGGTPLDYFGPNLEIPTFKDPGPLKAPKGTENVALGKPVTSSTEPHSGSLSQVTDGIKTWKDEAVVEIGPGHQWIQIDLEKPHFIYGIMLWHAYRTERIYFDVIVQASRDPEMKKDVVTIYNNDHDNSSGMGKGEDKEYIESHRGRLIALPDGVKGRYLRFYSNGGTMDEFNHYMEVEIYGVREPAGVTDETEDIAIELPEPHFEGVPL